MNIDQLRELFAYDAETGVFTNNVSRGRAKAGRVAGALNAEGYLRVKVNYQEYYLHRLAWLYETGSLPIEQIDHINGVKHDNRFDNLRIADNSQNSCNKNTQENNTSGFKGVSFHRKSGLWFAYANKFGQRVSGGYHKNQLAAHEAASRIRIDLHGQFANNKNRKQPITPPAV